MEVARKFADFSTPVLLIGETGSGKEMIAQAIHFSGKRQNGPFLSLHCGAIPGGLLESELFGYSGGAFSSGEGEDLGKAGKLELADGGTLFIEEIGLMPPDIQLKLLHYLKHKSFHRTGANEPISSDVRIIAAAQSSLLPVMEQGLFLEELFYQLYAMSIEIPPLRERAEDIPEFVQAFIREFCDRYHKPMPRIDPDAMTAFMNYDWPGNVRELRNVIERTVILCDGDTIALGHLPPGVAAAAAGDNEGDEEEGTLKLRSFNQKEDAIILEALRKAYGNKSAAAKLLGISRGTLYKKMKEYDIDV
ncbi:sigma-54 interaction domain-containing protein [Gordoniibacillus kamchatkensis]|uniref:sigma-54 interaction domain-containing protein n=1 Tax=Gordoniibacillus kamchatkensis TaxID=1590651 RepID=UPI000B2FA6B1|nr:sigma 54-interacting transcriptional regulator [Paenibacillus sp. VKM B-2647]